MPRRCEVQTPDGWHAHVFAALIPGMVFRLFEEDGTPVMDADGVMRWRALGLPGETDGRPTIDAEQVPETDVERAVRADGVFWPGGERSGAPSRLR